MGRKPKGKVRLKDPETGKFVWVDPAAIHDTADEPGEVEAPSPAQGGEQPQASAPIHPSSSATSIAPPIAPSIAPRPIAPTADEEEPDDLAEFLGERPSSHGKAPSAHRTDVHRTELAASSRHSSGDDVADFWAGTEPLVEDVEPES